MLKEYKEKQSVPETEREMFRRFSDTLAHLFYHRGMKTLEDAETFLSPSYDNTFDPYKLVGMERAVELIVDAIKENKKICIFSDYDADGIPGGAVFHDFLKMAGANNFFNYIPDRAEEGFGLSIEAVQKVAEEGAELLITVDCGVSDVEEVKFAKEKGLSVIVTDHHLVSAEGVPPADAVINPKISPEYEDEMLCGAGVAFKVVQAILQKERFGIPEGKEKWLLDLVGIATLSDMVPLQKENRIFAYYGLIVLRRTKRVGLQKLFRKIKINQSKITEDDVGFMIAPRINAASRMGISMDAFHLLTTESEEEAEILVRKLEEANNERKGTTAYLAKEVKKAIEAKYSPHFLNKVIVVGSPTWKPAVLGLVASSIAEKEMKPVFLWGREGSKEELKGSCRGVEGVSVTSIMSAVPEGVFVNFGGHHQAGGFSVSYDAVHTLDAEIEKAFAVAGSEEKSARENFVDFVLSPDDINNRVLVEIEKLAPFGTGNEKPTFLIKNALAENISFFGKEKNHLKVMISRSSRPLPAIAFFAPEHLVKKVKEGESFSFVGHLERDFFGAASVRLRILDIVVSHI